MSKVQRNDPCPCGSKLKYKNCCLFNRHGGERIVSRLQTGYDQVKETVKRLIVSRHEKKMNEIIKGPNNE